MESEIEGLWSAIGRKGEVKLIKLIAVVLSAGKETVIRNRSSWSYAGN